MPSGVKFTPPSAQNLLAGCALMFIGLLGVVMCFHAVPAVNRDFIVFILGALSGATTAVGAQKAIGTVTTSNDSTDPNIPAAQPVPAKPEPII